MNMLDYALAYADRGWAVFPVHTPQPDGGCSCRHADCTRVGKHPRISQGRNGATTDPDTIRNWWNVWPDANIGIATGANSGLVVLDVDEGGEAELAQKDLPDTVEQITGSGGRHLLYERPDDGQRYKTLVKFCPGLDSRADGGYIVAPPSMHVSGKRYEWEASSDPFDGVAVMPAPQWFIDAIHAPALVDTLGQAPEWNPDGELPNNITDMLSAIPADDYETWRDVGMALHYTDPADGLEVWDWWSSTASNYDGEAVRREWRNFSRRGHAVSNPVTLSTVRRLAEQHGWVDPDAEHGAEVAAILLNSNQQKQAEEIAQSYTRKDSPRAAEAPDVMPSNGLIREIAEHIISRSVRPQPLLAVMAATAFVGAMAGRKYQTETGLRSNVYIVGLAESGAGKDQARKEVNNIAQAAGVDHLIGGDRLASGPGVVTALHKSPSRLFLLDEIGLMLQAMTGQKADPHKRDMMATLMTLYSSAGSVYRGAEYADQKDRPRQDIVNPNACIYGTSTHSQFYASLTSGQGVDGTLSRLLVVSTDMHRPERQRPSSLGQPDPDMLARVKELSEHVPGGGNLGGMAGPGVDAPAHIVPMSPKIWEAWEELDDSVTEYMTDDASRSVYSRVAENAAKLALIHAVSKNWHSPSIDAESFAWGRELALWAANLMMGELARHVADNEVERDIKRVLHQIRDAGEDGIKQRDLLRRNKSIRAKDLSEICERLHATGEIIIEERKNARGRSSMVYIAT
jgi:hypothetical protein